MNFSIPDEKKIRKAFAEGEEAVVALFGEVTVQVEKKTYLSAGTAGNRLPATDTTNRTERTA